MKLNFQQSQFQKMKSTKIDLKKIITKIQKLKKKSKTL